MKIVYRHLLEHISENPSIEEISDCLFQLGHEHEIEENIFNMEFTPNRGDCLSINGLLRDLSVFYDTNVKLAKQFSLRGIPTSILINRDGYEFARIIGSMDFEDPKFVNWLLNHD